MSAGEARYDVVAVDLESSDVRVLTVDRTYSDADVFVRMAVMRRGVDEEFFAAVPTGRYRDGDKWKVNP